MRVLHIGKYYAPQRGGIERHTQDVAEWLVRAGVDVGVLVHQPRGQWRSTRENVNGVELCRVGCIAAPLYAPISPSFPLQLARAIDTMRPDLLHLHLPNPSCFAALASPRARALPWIVHWHADVSPDVPDWRLRAAYRVYRPFEQAVLARATSIIATSQPYLDASAALAGWRSKTRVIPLGLDAQPDLHGLSPAWPSADSLRLLAVGRLSHYKGFEVLIEALAQVSQASLVLIGNGEDARKLRDIAARHRLGQRISFVGEIDDAGLQAAYSEADLFVLPSLDRSEAFGLVLLEAMRAGLPVIASAIPGSGVSHVVQDGVTGLLVPPGDVDSLAKAIGQMASDAPLRARLGAAGQQRWQREFTLQRSAAAVLDLYLESLR
jgi:glycosyltransferase involved in cell wall biosynthesis